MQYLTTVGIESAMDISGLSQHELVECLTVDPYDDLGILAIEVHKRASAARVKRLKASGSDVPLAAMLPLSDQAQQLSPSASPSTQGQTGRPSAGAGPSEARSR